MHGPYVWHACSASNVNEWHMKSGQQAAFEGGYFLLYPGCVALTASYCTTVPHLPTPRSHFVPATHDTEKPSACMFDCPVVVSLTSPLCVSIRTSLHCDLAVAAEACLCIAPAASFLGGLLLWAMTYHAHLRRDQLRTLGPEHGSFVSEAFVRESTQCVFNGCFLVARQSSRQFKSYRTIVVRRWMQ